MRYQTAVPLGRGATGEVLRAWDPRLERAVALKLLRSDDPELVERMQREARLQAKVRHPHVAEVYEVGDWEGRPYIAMQLVDGVPLDEAAAGLPLAEKVRLMATVARAVHAAHEVGLVHRDLKPGNILVESGADGRPVPCVVDFGIARETAVAGQTVTGQMLGTPGYMSPEQARGETTGLDRRSDVFSLGAVLYELLTGAPPFAADSAVDSLVQVLSREPVPPSRRDRELPRDLETVVLTCLEKEPARRYPTAAALADDLEHYLAGEPVSARPVSRTEKLRRRLRRHPLTAGLGAAALLAVLVLAAVAVHSAWTSRARAEAAQRFGAEAERMASTMRQAHLAPLHDLSAERRYVEERMERVRAEMAELGGSAAGPGHRALGEGYAALDRPDEAREHLEAAWAAGHRTPETAYSLGRVLAGLYAEAREKALRSRDPETRAENLAAVDAELKQPALAHLERAEATPSVSPAYLAGLIAFVEGRWDDATAAAARARRESPLLWEAALLEGRATYQHGIEAFWAGDYEAALESYAAARGPLEAAAEIGSSDPEVWVRLCAASQLVLDVHRATGRSVEEPFRASLDACGSALAADPGNASAWEKTARAWWRWSEELRAHGEDPTEALEEVVEAARRSAELNPEMAHLGYNLEALGWNVRAQHESDRGVDPRPSLRRGQRAAEAAIAAEPGYRHGHNTLGTLWHVYAVYLEDVGEPAGDAWAAVARAYEGALEVDPEFTYAWNNLSVVHQRFADAAYRRGRDPEPRLRRALEASDRALELNPAYDSPLANQASTRRDLAEYRWRTGRPWRDELAAGVAAAERALEVNPEFAAAYANLAALHDLRARALAAAGENPESAVAEVRRAARAALAIKADHLSALETLADSHLQIAERAAEAGRPAPAELAAARASYRRILEIHPGAASAHLGLAECARVEARTAADPHPAYAEAEEHLRRARDHTAGPAPHLLAARLALARARRSQADGESPEAEVSSALAALEEARRHHAPVDEADLLQAEILLQRAAWNATGKDPSPDRTTALDLAKKVLTRHPGHLEATSLLTETRAR